MYNIYGFKLKNYYAGGKNMTEKMTRSEQQGEMIRGFLESNSHVLSMYLYGREVIALEKKYPVVITKGEKRGRLFKCSIFKRRVEQK